ncbi:metallophosphoesterase family protein [candidate division KSB1 bacterium]
MPKNIIKKVGVISDTHGRLNDKVRGVFEKVDIIIHCGDIGKSEIIVELEKLAPTYAVLGNIDKPFVFPGLKYQSTIQVNGFNILIRHEFDPDHKKHFKLAENFDLVFFGHTHIPFIKKQDDVIFVNPGSASQGRRGNPESVVLIDFSEENILPKIVKLT